MNFAASMPVSRTGFEQFVFQNFGADVPADAAIAAIALVAISLLFKTSLVSSDIR